MSNQATVSKAEVKRIKDTTDRILHIVTVTLAQKKNNILEFTGKWAVQQIEDRLTGVKNGSININLGTTKEKTIAFLESKLTKSTMIAFSAMKDAEVNFDKKVAGMVDKMVLRGMTMRFLKVEKTSAFNHDMEFLVHGENKVGEPMTVHARVIYACGAINAPHYRFITTVRK